MRNLTKRHVIATIDSKDPKFLFFDWNDFSGVPFFMPPDVFV